jgi:hypothetical protein
MGYTNLDKLLNVVLKLKYDWISKIDIPYHHNRHGNVDVYNVHVYINENIFNVVNKEFFPRNVYKIPLDEFENETKTKFKFLRQNIDDLFHSQILSGRIEQDIWIFIPKHLK